VNDRSCFDMSYILLALIFSQQSDDATDHTSCLTSLVSIIKGLNLEEGGIHRAGERSAVDNSEWSNHCTLYKVITETEW